MFFGCVQGQLATERNWRPRILTAIGFCLIAEPAYAYIDPGMGSLIFQSALAGFVTIAAMWAGLKDKIRTIFSRSKKGDGDEHDSAGS